MTEGTHTALDPVAVDALRELVGDDPEMLREIVVAFLEDAPERLGEITGGLDEGDSTLVRRAAHTLKSNAMTFGALDFANACRELEEAAKDGSLDEAGRLAAEVEREWALARPQIALLVT